MYQSRRFSRKLTACQAIFLLIIFLVSRLVEKAAADFLLLDQDA